MRPKIQIASGSAPLLVAAFFVISLVPGALAAQQIQPPPPLPPDISPGATFGVVRGGQGAFLGVGLKDVTSTDVRSMKLPGEYGAVVAHVEPDSPAAKAGLRENDVILEFGGMRVWSASQLEQLVRETPAGRTVTLRVSRSGKILNLDASLAQRNQPRMFSYSINPRIQMPQFHFDFGFPKYRLGIEVESLSPQLATYFRVAQGKGVLVTEVEANSPAAKAGLKAGDCIVKVGSTEVASVSDLMHALNDAAKPAIDLSIVRSGQEQTLSATLDAAPGPMQNQMFRRDIERQAQAIRRQAQALRRELPRREEMQRQYQQLLRELQQASLGEV
ncbi:MAG: PDZ domain-containing protein [Terriglobia bacterium]